MPKATITISDRYDTEYELQIDFDVLPAEPDVGIMQDGHEITGVTCTQITYHGGDTRVILPGANGGESAERWFGEWCWTTFEKQIEEKLAETPIEIDYPEYDRDTE